MALLEFLDTAKTARTIQIFGTDLGDPAFLNTARDGHGSHELMEARDVGETAEQIEGKHIWDTGHGTWIEP